MKTEHYSTQFYAKATGVRLFPHTSKPLAIIINGMLDSDRKSVTSASKETPPLAL